MRCDLNVSVKAADSEEARPGQRVEIKNMNSIKSLETAAEYEIKRQIECYERGEAVGRETRTYDAVAKVTRRMRAKEGAVDYRFFPEPDLPPLLLAPEEVEAMRATLPELPQATRKRLVDTYGLTAYDAAVLVGEAGAVAYFEELATGREPKTVANWVCNDLFGLLRQQEGKSDSYTLLTSPISTTRLGSMIDLIGAGRISVRTGKDVLAVMMFEDTVGSPEEIVQARDWEQISDEAVLRELAESLAADPGSEKQLRQYRQGKGQMMRYFVGQAMKVTNGRANPQMIEKALKEVLDAK
jgi:aspartyl-tRNA(Asn)/glutamyl-tRNA(Gln) amidotransferase subunit B